MTAQILDGRTVSKSILQRLTGDVQTMFNQTGTVPTLAAVIIGDDPASHTYVRMKVNRCHKIGMESRQIKLADDCTTERAIAEVRALSKDDSVDGIIVQHPAPEQVDETAVFEAIDPTKDVDGVTSTSLGSMAFNTNGYRSATPGGIIRLLDQYSIDVDGKKAVVIGRSRILGIPVGMLLLARNATVTYCHSHTGNLRDQVADADIVVAAAGRPGLVQGDWIKEGAVVVDAGYAHNTGDVDFVTAKERASHITPVPGGVGPMTIAELLAQTVIAHGRRHSLELGII